MVHMQWACNKARLKAHVSAVHQALYAATLDGSYTNNADVLRAKLNYTHYCPVGDVAGPCAKAWWTVSYPQTNWDRFIMPDGSIIWNYGGDRVMIKVENNKDASHATNGSGNALALKYNATMATLPACCHYPDVPPGELKPSITAPGCTDLYKKVFE